jgi:hypothetical protein
MKYKLIDCSSTTTCQTPEKDDDIVWTIQECMELGRNDPVWIERFINNECTQREILNTGLHARIWGADIMVSKIVPVGTVYACADPEFVGVMPVRQDIEVLPADEPKRLSLGWVVSEEIGLAVLVPRGVAAGRKSVAAGW